MATAVTTAPATVEVMLPALLHRESEFVVAGTPPARRCGTCGPCALHTLTSARRTVS